MVENLGIASDAVTLYDTFVVPGSSDIYIPCGQAGERFIVAKCAVDGTVKNIYKPPEAGPGSEWDRATVIWHPGVKKLFFGTMPTAHLMCLDPARLDLGVQYISKVGDKEEYIWAMAVGRDGTLYLGSFPGCSLYAYDVNIGSLTCLGKAHPTNKYIRSMTVGHDGRVYMGTGADDNDVVCYDPLRKVFTSIRPSEVKREAGVSQVYYTSSGSTLFNVGGRVYIVTPEGEVKKTDNKPGRYEKYYPTALYDGRTVEIVSNISSIRIYDSVSKKAEIVNIDIRGDGVDIFALAPGPDGKVYGSTILPLYIFRYNPKEEKIERLGNHLGFEVYSFANWGGKLFEAVYQNGALWRYDPVQPWNPGAEVSQNPYRFAILGPNFMRPRVMQCGEDKVVVTGSPDYGKPEGGLAVVDPSSCTVTAKYIGIVPNQSVVSVAYDGLTKKWFLGSSTYVGHIGKKVGVPPEVAVVAGVDIGTGKVLWKDSPRSLTEKPPVSVFVTSPVEGKIVVISGYGLKKSSTADESTGLYELFVYDTVSNKCLTKNIVLQLKGKTVISVTAYKGCVYANTEKEIICADIDDGIEIKTLYNTEKYGIQGLTAMDGYIYWGEGKYLMRMKL
ncbi:MAG: WD40 repeat domain-containing protein [Elusimicrobiota bacterium]